MDTRKQECYAKLKNLIEGVGGTLLSQTYVNSKTKLSIICPSGHEYQTLLRFLQNTPNRCPECSNRCPKQAREDFMKIVERKGGIVTGIYQGVNHKISIKCLNGHEWVTTPLRVRNRGGWCLKCAGNCTEGAMNSFLLLVQGKGGVVMDDYINAHTKVTIKCNQGHEWSVKPNAIKSGNWCSICSGVSPEQSRIDFEELVLRKDGILLDEYINAHTKVAIRCSQGHTWMVEPNQVKRGNWCTICARTCPKEAAKGFYNIISRKGGIALEPYINAYTKVKLLCSHGHTCMASPNSVKGSDTWCNRCRESKGERAVSEI